MQSETYYAHLQPENIIAFEGDTVTLTCSTNIAASFPRWEINDVAYEVTHFPPEYTVNGHRIEFEFVADVRFRCFFRIFLGGTVHICSNIVVVTKGNVIVTL